MPAPDVPNHVIVEIRVHHARAVKGFANLLASAAGTVQVYVASEVAEKTGLAVGVHLRCRVRRGGPKRVFAHPSEIHVG
jgi:hypothetical protein